MSYGLDMKEIERQVYLSYSEDGLVDIAIGTVITAWGLMLIMEPTGLIGLLGLLGLGIWYIGKRLITIPRIGVIEPGPKMERRMSTLAVFLVGLGIVVFVGILLNRAGGSLVIRDYSLAILGLVLAVGVAILAYLLNATRLYLYAVILFVSFAGGEILTKSIIAFDAFAFSVIIGGGLILIFGIVVLVRFMRKYPRRQMEA